MVSTNLRPGAALPEESGPGPGRASLGVRKVNLLRNSSRWVGMLLAAAYVVLGLAVPLFITLRSSVDLQPFWGAYSEQLTSSSLLIILGRTLLLAALTTVITIVIAYPVAYAMTLMGPRARAVSIGLLVLPQLTSYLVRTYAWIGILGVGGPVVGLMNWLGASTDTYNGTLIGVLVVLVGVFLPMVVLACYVSMSRIDPSHLRAARTLGANHLESFWRVYAPQSKSGVISGGALVFILTAGIYVTPALIGGPGQTTVVSLVVQQVTQDIFGVPPAYPAALSVILAAVVAIVLGLTSRSVGLSEVLGLKAASKVGTDHPPARQDRQRLRLLSVVVRRIPAGSGHHILVRAMVVVTLLLVDGPFVYLIGMSFQPLALLAFPTGKWSTKWYAEVFNDTSWGDAALMSLQIALLSTAVAVVVGCFLAFRTTKVRRFAGRTILAAAILPLIVPHVMYATGIFSVFTTFGLIGNWQAIALVHSVLAMPYVYVNVLNGLNSYDPRWDQAASSLGASPWRRLRKVTLPLLRPALVTGAFLAALTSIDEFTVTLFMGGTFFENLTLKFWSGAHENLSPELAVVGVLLTGLTLAAAALAVAVQRYARRATKSPRRSAS